MEDMVCFKVTDAIMLITYILLFQMNFSELECKILNIMGRKEYLTADDRKTITKRLTESSSDIESSKEVKRDSRTVLKKQ